MILFLAALQHIPQELYEAACDRRRQARLADLPAHHPAAAARHLGRRGAAAADRRLPGVRRVLQPAARTPPGARPPLVDLYYTALGRGQDYGAGSAGALILTALIMMVTLLQGRIFGFGKGDEFDGHLRRPTRVRRHAARTARERRRQRRRLHRRRRRGAAVPGPLLPAVRNALATDAEITGANWKFFPTTLHWGNISELFNDTDGAVRAQPVELARSSGCSHTAGQSCWSARWPATALARIPYQHANKIFYAVLVTLMVPTAVTFVPSFVLVSSLGWVSSLCRSHRSGAVQRFHLLPVPAVLPGVPQGAGGGGAGGRTRLLGHVLARSSCPTR